MKETFSKKNERNLLGLRTPKNCQDIRFVSSKVAGNSLTGKRKMKEISVKKIIIQLLGCKKFYFQQLRHSKGIHGKAINAFEYNVVILWGKRESIK